MLKQYTAEKKFITAVYLSEMEHIQTSQVHLEMELDKYNERKTGL